MKLEGTSFRTEKGELGWPVETRVLQERCEEAVLLLGVFYIVTNQ